MHLLFIDLELVLTTMYTDFIYWSFPVANYHNQLKSNRPIRSFLTRLASRLQFISNRWYLVEMVFYLRLR